MSVNVCREGGGGVNERRLFFSIRDTLALVGVVVVVVVGTINGLFCRDNGVRRAARAFVSRKGVCGCGRVW